MFVVEEGRCGFAPYHEGLLEVSAMFWRFICAQKIVSFGTFATFHICELQIAYEVETLIGWRHTRPAKMILMRACVATLSNAATP